MKFSPLPFLVGITLGTAITSQNSYAINIDGTLYRSEWKNAQSVTTFYQTNPYTGNPAGLGSQARITSTEDGIYIAVMCEQPKPMQSSTFSSRDADMSADFVRVLIDFDGSGQNGI